jgi:outer membrane lipoprotein-sorting protein
MGRSRALIVSTLAMLAVTLPAVSSAQTLDEIIAKNLASRGGADKLRSLDTVKITGTIVAKMPGAPGAEARQLLELPMTTWAKRPNKMRRDQKFPDRTVSVGFDGTAVWMLDTTIGKTQRMTGPEAEATKDDASFDPLFLSYEERGHKIELVGNEKLNRIDVHHLRVTKKNGQVEHHYLHTDTGLEFRTVTTIDQGGLRLELRTDLSDYRTVDGMQVAFGMQQFRNGEQVLEVKLASVEFNVPIEDAIFSMPQPGGGD